MYLDPVHIKRQLARRACERGAYALVSIDQTILDTRPRSVAILRAATGEFPEIRAAVASFDAHHAPSDPLGAIEERAALSPARRACLYAHWRSRFYDDAWLEYDEPYPGVAAFLSGLLDIGLQLIYRSNRDAPTMGRGTRESFARNGLPVEPAARFAFKRSIEEAEDCHTERLIEELSDERPIGLAIERDAAIANLIQRLCPRAIVYLHDRPRVPLLVKPDPSINLFREYGSSPSLVRG
ncbi:MAG: hypothetical protein ACLFP4_12165 [Spirochaetales bacterium]